MTTLGQWDHRVTGLGQQGKKLTGLGQSDNRVGGLIQQDNRMVGLGKWFNRATGLEQQDNRVPGYKPVNLILKTILRRNCKSKMLLH